MPIQVYKTLNSYRSLLLNYTTFYVQPEQLYLLTAASWYSPGLF